VTDVIAKDAFDRISAGRSAFRIDDLLELWRLLEKHKNGEGMVVSVNIILPHMILEICRIGTGQRKCSFSIYTAVSQSNMGFYEGASLPRAAKGAVGFA
jgi:hypothetical protein